MLRTMKVNKLVLVFCTCICTFTRVLYVSRVSHGIYFSVLPNGHGGGVLRSFRICGHPRHIHPPPANTNRTTAFPYQRYASENYISAQLRSLLSSEHPTTKSRALIGSTCRPTSTNQPPVLLLFHEPEHNVHLDPQRLEAMS